MFWAKCENTLAVAKKLLYCSNTVQIIMDLHYLYLLSEPLHQCFLIPILEI